MKLLKLSAYIGFICLIAFFIFINNDASWAPYVSYPCLIIAVIIFLYYIFLIIFIKSENKKYEKLLTDDNYEKLLEILLPQENKKHLFQERANYKIYLILLCYMKLNNEEKIEEYFVKIDQQNHIYPMVPCWKASYYFSKGNYENMNEYNEKFIQNVSLQKDKAQYSMFLHLTNAYALFASGKQEEAKEKVNQIDTSKITFPSTLNAVKIIQEYKKSSDE